MPALHTNHHRVRQLWSARRATTVRRVILLLSPAVAACSDGTGPNGANQVGLGFQIARSTMAAQLASASGGSGTGAFTAFAGAPPEIATTPQGLRITRDADTILVTKAQLVVRNVRMRNAAATCADDDSPFVGSALLSDLRSASDGGSRNDQGGRDSDDDDCPSMRVGPFLVDMPVTGADAARVSVPIPEGTYSSVRLSLHKVTGNDSTNAAFRQANPDFRDISVRLEGKYNGVAFVFVTDINARVDVPLTAPLVIAAGGDDVTVAIDLSVWFLRAQSGLYSPALANTGGSVRSLVQQNIQSAFRAFRDRNHDGRED
jgi:hypothetical protein